MRLIRSQIFRAIPELDRFTDEQCRRFVSAANSSWRRRILRWVLVGMAGVVGVVGASVGVVVVNSWIQDRLRFGEPAALLLTVITGCIGFAIALVPTLILRDFLLRLTIRRLIRRCGACPKCHYTLLGMRIAADQTITCPECGLKIDVDVSMGELATDEEGTAVYKPEVARDHAITKERRRKRHRRFFKVVGVLAILMLLGAAGWWVFLELQARRAIAERTAVRDIRLVQASMWPAGEKGTDDATRPGAEFARYLELVKACADAADVRKYAAPTETTAPVYFEASTLLPETKPAVFDKQNGGTEGSFVACKAFTLDVLRRAKETGVSERLSEILSMKGPIRPMAPGPGEPFVGVLVPDVGFARATARFNAARMILAREAKDRAEYMAALEETLAIAQIVERQGLLIDRLVAIAIDSLVFRRLNEDKAKFPDAAWYEDALAILKRRGAHSALSKTMDVERLAGLDSVQWFFSSPKRVAKAHFGIGETDPFGFSWSGSRITGSVGTYGQNRAAWNAAFAGYMAAADAPRSTRPPLMTAPTGLILIDQLGPGVASVFRSEDNNVYEQRMCTLWMACDLFTLRNGRPPSGPGEIAELLPDPAAVVDPLSDKPYRFIVGEEAGKDGRSFEIRDGEEDEPKPGQPPKTKPAAKPAAKPGPKK